MLTRSSQCWLHPYLVVLIPLYSPSSSTLRPEPHGRGGGSQPGQADSPLPEQDEEILGSDDDEQEDPNDYCRGRIFRTRLCTSYIRHWWNNLTWVHLHLSSIRWISPCEDWRSVQWEIPCDTQAGLGALLHRVAGLGHPVGFVPKLEHVFCHKPRKKGLK